MLTRCTTLCAVVLCSAAGLAYSGMSGPRAHAPEAAPAAITAAAPAVVSAVETDSAAALNCTLGFSKDYCGTMDPGQVLGALCLVPSNCRTLHITGATFAVNMTSNGQVCGPTITSTCDEAPNGVLKVASNFRIRAQQHCPWRGCWESTGAEYQLSNGDVFRGTLMGTIGVGTHRPISGPIICSVSPFPRNCERCYDVSFDPLTSTWRVGYEAVFMGVNPATGEELCFSLSGDFLIPGTNSGPSWGSPWRVVGTADGTFTTFCQ